MLVMAVLMSNLELFNKIIASNYSEFISVQDHFIYVHMYICIYYICMHSEIVSRKMG